MTKKKLTGIRLMAETLGVSTATISRAMNPATSHKVKESLRQEIQTVADKMRYHPNPGARLIQRGHNSTLSVLVPPQEDVFFSEFYGRLLGGMIHAVQGTSWEVRINTINLDKQNVLDEFRRMGLGRSGLLYAGQPLTCEQVDSLTGYYSPLILLSSALPPDYPLGKPSCHVLGVDNYQGAVEAAKYVAGLGHQRIGLILGPVDSRDFAERERGYRDGLGQVGITLTEEMIYRGSYDQASGRAGCEHFMAQTLRPTALICASDSLAVGALEQAKERHLNCPQDVSVMGFDDGPWATACSPKLTTIRQPLDTLTQQAVRILANSITMPGETQFERTLFAPELVVRGSTAAVQSA